MSGILLVSILFDRIRFIDPYTICLPHLLRALASTPSPGVIFSIGRTCNQSNLILLSMGNCIAACARAPKMPGLEINNEDQAIKKQLESMSITAKPDGSTEQPASASMKQPEVSVSKPPEESTMRSKASRNSAVQSAALIQTSGVSQKPSEVFAERNIEEEENRSEKKAGGKGLKASKDKGEDVASVVMKAKNQKDSELIKGTFRDTPVLLDKIQLQNGIVYEGEWMNGMRHGQGTQIWVDSSRYVGEWKNNEANGYGKLYHSDGDMYEGEWLNDKANGKGTYTHSNGAKYVGDWKDDKQHGKGVEEWLDGAKYEGDYEDGAKNGNGLLKFLDGSYYEGGFLDNEIHGYGIYLWSENRKYEGQWAHNKMHGKGKILWNDGRKYEGDYQNDKKHGFGIFQWSDGRKYIGSWCNGKQHGRGQYISSKGQKKVGEWADGKRIRWTEQASPS